MKIAYSHLVSHIQENPSIKEMVSDSLFQLGHEHEIEEIFLIWNLLQIEETAFQLNGFLEIYQFFIRLILIKNLY